MFFRCISKTLNGRLPHEDSSDFDDFWTELIVMTWSIIWDKLRFFSNFFVRGRRCRRRRRSRRRRRQLLSLLIQIKRKVKWKQKQKRKRGNLRGGREAPSP